MECLFIHTLINTSLQYQAPGWCDCNIGVSITYGMSVDT